MKNIFLALAMVAGVAGLASGAGAKDEVAGATAAAKSWLALSDGGQYEQSWDAAAAFLRGAVTKAAFVQGLTGVRTPLGTVRSRQVLSTTRTHQAPGAPDGDYVIIRFQTVFEKKARAIETVTPVKENDGTWRVSGYYIK